MCCDSLANLDDLAGNLVAHHGGDGEADFALQHMKTDQQKKNRTEQTSQRQSERAGENESRRADTDSARVLI